MSNIFFRKKCLTFENGVLALNCRQLCFSSFSPYAGLLCFAIFLSAHVSVNCSSPWNLLSTSDFSNCILLGLQNYFRPSLCHVVSISLVQKQFKPFLCPGRKQCHCLYAKKNLLILKHFSFSFSSSCEMVWITSWHFFHWLKTLF